MEAIGPVLIVLSIPLMLRWVPPNRFYGFRVTATCSNRSVWYDANALSARHLRKHFPKCFSLLRVTRNLWQIGCSPSIRDEEGTVAKEDRGFASMDRNKQCEIASKAKKVIRHARITSCTHSVSKKMRRFS
jgi:hypothetical protein